MGLVNGNFSRLWSEDRHEASPRYLRRYKLKVSIPLNGLTCVYYPELVKDCHDRGHELVAHGWEMGERLYMLTREQERENILKTIDAIVKVTGERPTGWSSPGVRPTDNTVELLVETGLEYHCDFHDDEMPYPIWVGDKLISRVSASVHDQRSSNSGRGNAPRILREIQRRVRLPLQNRRREPDDDERDLPRLSELAHSFDRYVSSRSSLMRRVIRTFGWRAAATSRHGCASRSWQIGKHQRSLRWVPVVPEFQRFQSFKMFKPFKSSDRKSSLTATVLRPRGKSA